MAPNLINTLYRSSHTHVAFTLKKKRYREGVGAAVERRCLSKFHTRVRRSGVEKETVQCENANTFERCV